MSELFLLKWNNHHPNLVDVFDQLLKRGAFIDVTLSCSGRNFQAHRVVLSACSTYFQELLMNTPCKHPVIFLRDVSCVEMESLLTFMYKGEVNIAQENLSSLLRLAQALQIKGLTDVGDSSPRNHPSSPREDSFEGYPSLQDPARFMGNYNDVNEVPRMLNDSGIMVNPSPFPKPGRRSRKRHMPRFSVKEYLSAAVSSEPVFEVTPTNEAQPDEKKILVEEDGNKPEDDSGLEPDHEGDKDLDAAGNALTDGVKSEGSGEEKDMDMDAGGGTDEGRMSETTGGDNEDESSNPGTNEEETNDGDVPGYPLSLAGSVTNSPAPFRCPLCPSVLSSSSSYGRHLKKHGAQAGCVPLYRCDACNYYCYRKDNFEKHFASQKHQKLASKTLP